MCDDVCENVEMDFAAPQVHRCRMVQDGARWCKMVLETSVDLETEALAGRSPDQLARQETPRALASGDLSHGLSQEPGSKRRDSTPEYHTCHKAINRHKYDKM